MPTSFPTAVDSLSNPTASNKLNSPSHSEQHINANDAIMAIQQKLGIDSSPDTNSVDYKLAQAIATLASHVSNTSNPHSVTKAQLGLGNVDNTSDATKKNDIIQTIYPVGSLYISTLTTNPNTLLGFGTWATFGAGRVLVGRDSGDTDFDTSEETGGAKTHTHALTNGRADIAATGSDLRIRRIAETFTSTVRFAASGGTTETVDINFKTLLSGNADSGSTLQPYIVVYMWKRTA